MGREPVVGVLLRELMLDGEGLRPLMEVLNAGFGPRVLAAGVRPLALPPRVIAVLVHTRPARRPS